MNGLCQHEVRNSMLSHIWRKHTNQGTEAHSITVYPFSEEETKALLYLNIIWWTGIYRCISRFPTLHSFLIETIAFRSMGARIIRVCITDLNEAPFHRMRKPSFYLQNCKNLISYKWDTQCAPPFFRLAPLSKNTCSTLQTTKNLKEWTLHIVQKT